MSLSTRFVLSLALSAFLLSPLFVSQPQVPQVPQIQGSLDKRIIQRVLRRHMRAVRTCYAKSLGKNATLPKGIAFTISPTGKISGLSLDGIKDPALKKCLRRALKKMRFPKPKGGGTVRVHYPLLMSSAGSGFSGNFSSRQAAPPSPRTEVLHDALSTFSIDVDTASYSIARRALDDEALPEPSLVRVEEFLNYFRYAYEPPSKDAGASAFSIQVDGARSPIDGKKHLMRIGVSARSLTKEERAPADVVFLVDTSCSMTGPDRLDLVKRSLHIAVDQLTAKDRVAITTYAGGVRLVLPPTTASQKARIKKAINGLSSGGGTAMSSGMEIAYKQAHAMLAPGRTTRIIVCSDGDANIGKRDHHAILKSVEGYVSEGVFLTTVGFGDSNYKDELMEQLADKGNGNYFYVDGARQAQRVFGEDLNKMLQTVAQDVKVQVKFNEQAVASYRLIGYDNRAIADKDFANDKVDAGEIGAGHQVTALYELELKNGAPLGNIATVALRAKRPKQARSKEIKLKVYRSVVDRPFEQAHQDMRFATAVVGAAEILRESAHAKG